MQESAHKHKMISDTLVYSAASYFSQAVGMITSVALRNFLGPVLIGVWGVLQVILDYCGQASLGTTRAMARDYPYYIGKGETNKAEDIKNVTLSFTIAMSWIPFLILAGYILKNFANLEPAFRTGLFFLLVFLFIQRFYDFLTVLLRAEKSFKTLAVMIISNSLMGLIFAFTCVRAWGLNGLMFGTAVTMIILSVWIIRHHRYRFKFFINRSVLVEELRLALPLAASAFLLTFLKGLDKLVIAKNLGFYEVGIYSIAMMVSNYIMSMPMMFAHVWYPNLQQALGRNQGNIRAVWAYLEKPIYLFSILIPFLSAASMAVMPIFVHYFLRSFADGLPVMRFYLLGIFFLVLGQFANNFLITMNRIREPFFILAAAIAGAWGLSLFLIHSGFGLMGAACGTLAGFFIYGIGCIWVVLKQLMESKERMHLIIKSIGVYCALFAASYWIDTRVYVPSIWIAMISKLLLIAAVYVPAALWLDRQTKLFSDLFQWLCAKMKKSK